MATVVEYLDEEGGGPFAEWFDGLGHTVAARIAAVVARMEQGSLSNAKSVGAGVFEMRANFGPGYRIYFGKDGDELVILLGGGTKRRQDKDIADAKLRWADYKKRR
jgi:putative addiction module killer protein